MELIGERLIPAYQQRTWDALNDPEVLKGCIPGCETLERTEEGGFVATLSLRIGPVSAKFKGKLQLSDVQAPNAYTIHFDGQGGMAGFGKGSAQVQLAAADGGTRLSYQAKAQVGGKLAQVGSRLVDAAAAKITNDFFEAFCTRVAEAAQAAGEAVPAASAAQNSDAPQSLTQPLTQPVSQPVAQAAQSSPSLPAWVWWAGAAAVALLGLLALGR